MSRGLGNHGCILKTGQEVARNVLRGGSSVQTEMAEFRRGHFRPSSGWFYSSDGKKMTTVTDDKEAVRLIGGFAHTVLDDTDPAEYKDPRLSVGSDFGSVVAHAMTPEGAIDLAKIQELEGRFGSNGGRGCDVRRGPCSCGAWH